MGLIIRKYTDSDFFDICKLENKIFKNDSYSVFFLRQAGEILRDTFFVAQKNNELIGYALGALDQGNPTKGWILSMGVTEEFRRKKIGEKLLDVLIKALKKKKVKEIFLSVSPENTQAISLYKKHGFQLISERKAYFGPNEDRYIMRKVIDLKKV